MHFCFSVYPFEINQLGKLSFLKGKMLIDRNFLVHFCMFEHREKMVAFSANDDVVRGYLIG